MTKTRLVALAAVLVAASSSYVLVRAQGAVGQNVNVVTGSGDQFTGDMFRQRQNEPVIGISSVNPMHMMAAYNDYRTVDYPLDVSTVPPSLWARLREFLKNPFKREGEREGEGEEEDEKAAANAWIGVSFRDGQQWYSGLHPGHHLLPPVNGAQQWDQSPQLTAFDAASDPVMATTQNQFFVGGIAFTPNGSSAGFVSRWTDHNNTETGQNLHFDGTRLLLTQPMNYFVDKPSVAAAPGPNGQAYVYAAFVVFDQTDPKKLSSKIQFYRSTDSGVTWSGPLTVSQPLTRNQAPWIVVDPSNPQTVYIGWRVFAAQSGGIANAIVGRKSTNGGASFTPAVPYPVALLLKAFDQPQGSLPAGPPIPRSNAYPSAAIDGNGAIHVALQEYVYPVTYPTAALRGLPLGPLAAVSTGVPRITVTSSYDGGSTWTIRKAIDLGNGAGTQFMPAVTAVGEPGPSCAGKTGPKSRVAVVFYDARAGGVGITPNTANPNSYAAGGATQFDVRIAQASAGCGTSGLTFGASEQLSQYTRTAAEGHGIVTTAGFGLTAVNRAYSNFCGGNCAFTGDYVGTSPRVPYVQNSAGAWVLTTAASVNKARLPAPVVVGVWADARDVKLPTTGLTRAGTGIDALPWDQYAPPGTGQVSCINPGSRDQNVYAAEYTPGGLFAFAPETFRVSNIPRAYPVSVENRRATTALYELTIDPAANASFKYESFDVTRQPPVALFKKTGVVVAPYSTVSGSVVVGPGVSTPVSVTVVEVDANGVPVPNGATTAVTLYTAGDALATDSETHAPLVSPTPIVSKPFGDRISPSNPLVVTPTTPFTQNPFSQNPFSQNPFSQNPFSQNPFSQNPFSQNPFSQNPFSQNPFSQNALPIGDPTAPTAASGTIYDVTDVSFVIVNGGNEAAAFTTLLNLEQSFLQNSPSNYLFQVLISKISLTPGLTDCQVIDRLQDLPVASFVTPFTQNPFTQNPFSQNPFSQNPFTQNPFSQNPFSQNPFSQNPFSQNPFSQNPFSQNPSPRDPVVSNSTFYLAPPATPGQSARLLAPNALPGAAPDVRLARADGDTLRLRPTRLQGPLPPAPTTYRAGRPYDAVLYTLRASQISPAPPVPLIPLSGPDAGRPPVSVSVAATTPNVVPLSSGGTGFDPGGPPASSGGSAVPVKLAFAQQPTAFTPGATITPPVVVAVRDGFGNLITTSTLPVTLALGTPGGTLSGTLTRNAVNGLATFNNLSINAAGTYTLVASAPTVTIAVSDPFSSAATLVVTNTADSGSGSLRQAILNANAIAGGPVVPITFNIPGTGPFVILPQTPLPTMTRPVSIDATTQPGYAGLPIVELNGSNGGTGTGLQIMAGGSLVRGLMIDWFDLDGILLQGGGGNVLQNNWVGGFDPGVGGNGANGIHIVDSADNTIGGLDTVSGNTITGNSGEGVRIDGADATRNVVQGNVIGVVSFNIGSGNAASGVYVRRAPGNSVIGNRVEGNTGFAGVAICGAGLGFCGGGDIGKQTGDATGTVVQGNTINGNAGYGVSIDGAPNTLVGGTDAVVANTITSSGAAGVIVFNPGSTGNRISRNNISSNGGIGIDLNGDGVTLNDPSPDADAGPNNLQNYPVLTSAFSPNIIGTLDSAPNTIYTLQFFENDTGNREAARFLLQTTVTTDGNGHASFDITATITGDAWVTATATDPAGNTSEFAAPAPTTFEEGSARGEPLLRVGEQRIARVGLLAEAEELLVVLLRLSGGTGAFRGAPEPVVGWRQVAKRRHVVDEDVGGLAGTFDGELEFREPFGVVLGLDVRLAQQEAAEPRVVSRLGVPDCFDRFGDMLVFERDLPGNQPGV